MEKLIYLIIFCICFVTCKKEKIPLRESPVVYLEKFRTQHTPYYQDTTYVFLTDKQGQHIACFSFFEPSEILIPDSINNNEAYNLTELQIYLDSISWEYRYHLRTFTNVKVNSIERIESSFDYQENPQNYNFVKFRPDLPRDSLECLMAQNDDLDSKTFLNYPLEYTGRVHEDVNEGIFLLKKNEEPFVRYLKKTIPSNYTINVDVMEDMEILNDPIIEKRFPDFESCEAVINGIRYCNPYEIIPLSMNYTDSRRNRNDSIYSYIEGNELDIDAYLSYFYFRNETSEPSVSENYIKYQKGKIIEAYQPQTIDYHSLHSEFQQFQIILPKPNSIARIEWIKRVNQGFIIWEVYGDYLESFQGPKTLPVCFDDLSLINVEPREITTYASSDFSNYEDYVNFINDTTIPFYKMNFCNTSEVEFYEERNNLFQK